MRVLIAAPRKSGSALLRCLLASAFGLQVVGTRDAPGAAGDELDLWLNELPDNTIAGVGFPYSPALASTIDRTGITMVAILRHPFDLFVSNHDVAQQRAARKKDRAGDGSDELLWSRLAGRELGDQEIIAYAETGFADEIAWLQSWRASGAPVVELSQLELDPAAALSELSHSFGALTDEQVAHAVTMCPPESVIVSRPFRGRRMPGLPAGTWRERLPVSLLDVLRKHYADQVVELGYEVE
jgi:hypothetical protein